MSRKQIDIEVERMLKDGAMGVLVSSVCLGAALALKRGGSTELTDVQSDLPLTPGMKSLIREVHAKVLKELVGVGSSELDAAIALYTAHLKAAGYTTTAGPDN